MPVNIDAIIKVAAIQGVNQIEKKIGDAVARGIADRLPVAIDTGFKRLNLNAKSQSLVKGIVEEIRGGAQGKGLEIAVSRGTIKNLTNLITVLRSIKGETGKSSKELANALGTVIPDNAQRAVRSILVAQRAVNQLRKALASGDAGRVASASKRVNTFLSADPRELFGIPAGQKKLSPLQKGQVKVFTDLRKDIERELDNLTTSYASKVRKASDSIAKENAKLARAIANEAETKKKEKEDAARKEFEQSKIAQARTLRSLADERFNVLKDVARRAESEKGTLKDNDFVQRVLGDVETARTQRANTPTTKQEILKVEDLDKEIAAERERLALARQTGRELNARLAYEKAITEQRTKDEKIASEAQKRRNDLRQRIAERARSDEQAAVAAREKFAKKNEIEIKKASALAERYKRIVEDAVNISARLGRPISNDARRLQESAAQLEDFVNRGGRSYVPPGGSPPGGGPPNNPLNDDESTARMVRNQNKINKSLIDGKFSVEAFGKSAALAAKRYAAFLAGSFVFYRLGTALSTAGRNALEFEAIITKVQQVLSTTNFEANKIADSIRDVAAQTGISAQEIGSGVLTFAQAGVKDVQQLAKVAKSLANTQLDATFGDVKQTSEGLLAIFGQFGRGLSDTANTLDLIRQFSADFAVESQDIFEGVERGGAVFATAGGSLEEFIALFSVLRERTRESASTLGVFFKTGITQLLSPKSQTIIRQLGIESTNTVSQLRELSEVFFGVTSTLNEGERVNLANQLVGQRQVARLLSLLRELNDPQVQERVSRAFELAPGSLDRAVVARLDDVGQSLKRISESFGDILKEFSQNEGIKQIATLIANLTESLRDFNKIAGPTIPLLTGLAAAAGASFVGRGLKAGVRFALGRPTSAFGAFAGGVRDGVTDITTSIDPRANDNRERRQEISGIVTERRNLRRQIRGTRDKAALAQLREDRKFWNKELRRIRGSTLERIGRSATTPLGVATGLGVASAGVSLFADNLRNEEGARGGIPSRFSGGDVASAISGGLGLAGVGLLAGGPWGAAAGFVGGAGLSIAQSIGNNQRAIRQARLEQAKTLADSFKAVSANKFGGQKSANDLLKSLDKGDEVGIEVKALVNREAQAIFESVTSGRNETMKNLRDQIEKIQSDISIPTSEKIKLLKQIDEQRADFVKRLIVQSLQKQFGSAFTEAGISGDQQDINAIIATGLADTFKSPEFKSQVSGGSREGDIQRAGSNIRDAVRFSNLIINDVSDRFEKFSRDLESIYTDRTSIQAVSLTDDNFRLLEQAGFAFADVREQIRNDAIRLQEFTERLNSFGGLNTSDLLNNDFDTAVTLDQLLKSITGSEDSANALLLEFGPILERVSATTGQGFVDLIKGLDDGLDPTEFLKSGSIAEIQDRVAESIREAVEIYNLRIAKEQELEQKIQQSNVAIEGLNRSLQDLTLQAAGRANDRADFATQRRDVFNIARRNADTILSGVSGGGVSPTLRDRAVAASNELSRATQARGAAERDGNIDRRLGAFEDQAKALNEYNRIQIEINSNATDLERNMQLAAQATEILRKAFYDFENQLVTTGRETKDLTRQNAQDIIQVFKIFRRAGGFQQPGERGSPVGGALDKANFNGAGLDVLLKGLSLIGDLDIGNGRTGNQISDDIFKSLATPFLAGLLTALRPGTTQADNEAQINKSLEELRIKADEAAKAEAEFRDQQKSLVTIQTEMAGLEKKFYEEQSKLLGEVSISVQSQILGELSSINSVVSKLFTNPIKTTDLGSMLAGNERLGGINEEIDALNEELKGLRSGKQLAVDEASVRADLTRFGTVESNDFFQPFWEKKRKRLFEPTDEQVAAEMERRKALQDPGLTDIPKRIGELREERQKIIDEIRGAFFDPGKPISASISKESTQEIAGLLGNSNILLEKIASGGVTSKMEIAPMQVNVALTVPDVMALVGPMIKQQVIGEVVSKLAAAFGDDPERYSKITAIT